MQVVFRLSHVVEAGSAELSSDGTVLEGALSANPGLEGPRVLLKTSPDVRRV
jgi:hypothetical protein